MLTDYPLDTILAVKDIGRARQWYSDKLGWTPSFEVEAAGVAVYQSEGSTITIYQTENAGTAKNTVAAWRVLDLRSKMAELKARGVAFEDYDFGDDFKTVDGVMTDPEGGMNAWFLDGDGNTWTLLQFDREPNRTSIGPMLAASDLDRAKRWYTDLLGREPIDGYEGEVWVFTSDGSHNFSVYRTEFAGTAKNTVAGWNVKDIQAEMAALRAKGITFEEYDFGGGFKTVDGVMDDGQGNKTAWFKDSEGNILGFAQEYRGD